MSGASGKPKGEKSLAAMGASAVAPVSKPNPAPKAVENDREAALLVLLAIEAEAREAATETELNALICNETSKICKARQVFAFQKRGETFEIAGVSAMATVDRTAPLLQWLEQTIDRLGVEAGLDDVREFNVAAYMSEGDAAARSYPLREALWSPFKDRKGSVTGGMLLTREVSWTERDVVVAKRLSGTYAHAFITLQADAVSLSRFIPRRSVWLLTGCLLSTLAFVPVTMTTLAPVEVTAQEPAIVAAAIDGVIQDVPIEPNAPVKTGQVVVRFVDTELKNRLQVAEREVLVAEARLKTTTQVAFADPRGKHELAVVRADLALKSAERDYARDLLARAEIRAEQAGLAVFSNKNDLLGRPVSVGERLIQIADPKAIEFQIDVPVADALILENGAQAKVFLDSSPLSSLEAQLVRSDFLSRPNDGVTLSFRVIARATETLNPVPRLGARGTAQIYGKKVSLGFYLLRRPYTVLRQWTGL